MVLEMKISPEAVTRMERFLVTDRKDNKIARVCFES